VHGLVRIVDLEVEVDRRADGCPERRCERVRYGEAEVRLDLEPAQKAVSLAGPEVQVGRVAESGVGQCLPPPTPR